MVYTYVHSPSAYIYIYTYTILCSGDLCMFASWSLLFRSWWYEPLAAYARIVSRANKTPKLDTLLYVHENVKSYQITLCSRFISSTKQWNWNTNAGHNTKKTLSSTASQHVCIYVASISLLYSLCNRVCVSVLFFIWSWWIYCFLMGSGVIRIWRAWLNKDPRVSYIRSMFERMCLSRVVGDTFPDLKCVCSSSW